MTASIQEQLKPFQNINYSFSTHFSFPSSVEDLNKYTRRLIFTPPIFNIDVPPSLTINTSGKNINFCLFQADENRGPFATQITGGVFIVQNYREQLCVFFQERCVTDTGRGGFQKKQLEQYLLIVDPKLRLYIQKQDSQSQTLINKSIMIPETNINVGFPYPNIAIIYL